MTDGALDSFIALLQESLELDERIAPQTPLLSSGLIDSFQVTALLAAIEQRFGKRIAIEGIGTDNFDTAEQMLKFISNHS